MAVGSTVVEVQEGRTSGGQRVKMCVSVLATLIISAAGKSWKNDSFRDDGVHVEEEDLRLVSNIRSSVQPRHGSLDFLYSSSCGSTVSGSQERRQSYFILWTAAASQLFEYLLGVYWELLARDPPGWKGEGFPTSRTRQPTVSDQRLFSGNSEDHWGARWTVQLLLEWSTWRCNSLSPVGCFVWVFPSKLKCVWTCSDWLPLTKVKLAEMSIGPLFPGNGAVCLFGLQGWTLLPSCGFSLRLHQWPELRTVSCPALWHQDMSVIAPLSGCMMGNLIHNLNPSMDVNIRSHCAKTVRSHSEGSSSPARCGVIVLMCSGFLSSVASKVRLGSVKSNLLPCKENVFFFL